MWLPCCRMSLGGTAEGLGGEEVRVYIPVCTHHVGTVTHRLVYSAYSLWHRKRGARGAAAPPTVHLEGLSPC